MTRNQVPTHSRKQRQARLCKCPKCNEYPFDSKTADLHHFINRFMSLHEERGRRLFAGLLLAWNGGDDKALGLTAAITGLDPRTITKGLAELQASSLPPLGWSRREGGGRKPK